METLTKNQLISDYLQQFDKEEWPNVIEHLLELAITTINENNQKKNVIPKMYQSQGSNSLNKQKFTVKKVVDENINCHNSKKDKLFHVSIDNIIKDSENKKNNAKFSLTNKFDKLSNQLTDIDKKNKRFNVQYYN